MQGRKGEENPFFPISLSPHLPFSLSPFLPCTLSFPLLPSRQQIRRYAAADEAKEMTEPGDARLQR